MEGPACAARAAGHRGQGLFCEIITCQPCVAQTGLCTKIVQKGESMIFQTLNRVRKSGLKGALRAFALGLPVVALLGALSLSGAQPARADDQSGWDQGQQQIDFDHYTLRSLGGGRWLVRNRRTGDTQVVREHPADRDGRNWRGDRRRDRHDVLGRVWRERESGWDGVWRRRGDSNTFDARWTKPGGGYVAAELHMQIDDSGRVRIDRRDTGSNLECQYFGQLSDDGHSVSGRYRCTNSGDGHSWAATIQR